MMLKIDVIVYFYRRQIENFISDIFFTDMKYKNWWKKERQKNELSEWKQNEFYWSFWCNTKTS